LFFKLKPKFTSFHPELILVGRGLKRAIKTIFIMLSFLFVIVYFYGVIGFALYNRDGLPLLLNHTCTEDACVKYFNTPYSAFFTMFQVLSGDSWAEGVAIPLEKNYPYISYIFFVSFVCFTGFIIMNVVTGVMLDAIANGKQGFDLFLF
jgi:voltage-gated sodium channel